MASTYLQCRHMVAPHSHREQALAQWRYASLSTDPEEAISVS